MPQQPIDPDAYRHNLERIGEIFGSIMITIDELVGNRCPYKNRFDQCTAGFGCRNQRKSREPGQLQICGGDDKLDYRSAWQDG